jgi:alpha-1,3-glucosyltransferase
MEITLNTPINEWYIDTPSNPLEYWGIDYPPLSAYQSYLSGLVVRAIEPAAVHLNSSRGYESPSSKQAMRLTVILSDLIGVLFSLFSC